MDDVVRLERQLAQAEQLLNVLDALRPDLPTDELHELALQMLCSAGDYTSGSLWVYREPNYQSVVFQGFDRPRSTLLRGAMLDAATFQRLLAQLQSGGGVHWWRWSMPPDLPEPLQSSSAAGHTLILPLAYTDQIGFAALESAALQPDDETLVRLGRYGDKVAVALDTARIFQERTQTIEELQQITESQRQLQATVLELSTPLLPILPGVLLLPLIGVIDTLRAERILEAELAAIIQHRAAVVLVDITGAPVVDTNVAMQLIRSADAARLLGCRTILVGVQPEIAQTLVGLGVNLRGITTRATLAEGLKAALHVIRQRLVRVGDD